MPLKEIEGKMTVNFHRRKPDALTMVSIFLFQQKRPLLYKYPGNLEDPTVLKSSCLEDSDTKPKKRVYLFSW